MVGGGGMNNRLHHIDVRGKSGHYRARCLLTGGRRESMESAAETTRPMAFRCTGKGEIVR